MYCLNVTGSSSINHGSYGTIITRNTQTHSRITPSSDANWRILLHCMDPIPFIQNLRIKRSPLSGFGFSNNRWKIFEGLDGSDKTVAIQVKSFHQIQCRINPQLKRMMKLKPKEHVASADEEYGRMTRVVSAHLSLATTCQTDARGHPNRTLRSVG